MSDGIKPQGLDDLYKLLQDKKPTWEAPETLGLFLMLIKLVIETSKYKDMMLKDPSWLPTLREVVRMKTERIRVHPDLEECIDVASYTYMIFDHIIRNVYPENLSNLMAIMKKKIKDEKDEIEQIKI